MAASDACTRLIPAAVARAVARELPEYRLPRETDNRPEQLAAQRAQGGSGCPGVAHGSFRSFQRETALLLVHKTSGLAVLALVYPGDGSWHAEILRHWGSSVQNLYVTALKPGTYHRTRALIGSADAAGELDELSSTREAIVAGEMEASGVVYSYVGGHWVHVWISD